MNKSAPKAQNTKAEATAATDPVAIIRSLWLGTCARYTVLCLTLAAWVRRSDKLSTGAKVGLHALATLGGFYLFCYLPYQVRTKPAGMQVLIILLLVAILYAVAMGIYAAITAKTRQRQVNDTPYESQFRKD